MSYHAPKKSLGQNFLTSIPARIAIVEAGELSASDTVLEIGPGKGFLTKGLLETGAKVIALEKDRELIPILSETFAPEIASNQLTLIEGDALEFEPAAYFGPPSADISPRLDSAESGHLHRSSLLDLQSTVYSLVANIPYYITGAILSRYLSHTHQPAMMVVLVQKEVAVRVCAKDNKESLLSLSVKGYGTPKLVYKVSKGSFFPVPSVDSAVLQIKNISRSNFKNQYHEAIFFKLIHAGFAHKRKFAISNIKQVFTTADIPKLFQEVSLSEKVRAEDVPLETWLRLSQRLTEATK